MAKRWITLAILAFVSVSFWLINLWYHDIYLVKLGNTIVAATAVYAFFRLILEEQFISRIKDQKQRYILNKAIFIIYFFISLLIVLIIWVENLQALLVGFGLIAAGLTIALQEVAKNLMGGLLIVSNRIYSIGDRIEINSQKGDVIDIGLLYTTIMETNVWISSDQPTGRLTIIPNGQVLSNTVNNYTKDFGYLWDEITIPVTYDSDWMAAKELIMEVVEANTDPISKLADKQIPDLERKYFVSGGSTKPSIFMRLTDNWIELSVRYITQVRERRSLRHAISTQILEGIQSNSDKIKIASQTYDIVGLPKIQIED